MLFRSAKRAYEARRDVPQIADTYGWILVHNGQTAAALPILEAAAVASKDDPEIEYHLGAAYVATRDMAKAAGPLRAALQSPKPFQGRAEAEQLLKSLGGK